MSRLKTRQWLLPITLGLAHGVSDGAAGFLLGSLTHSMALQEVGMLVLLYNLLAFGAQPVAGLVVDRLKRPQAASVLGLACNGAALLLMVVEPRVAVLLAGLGSALFHVGGGALALWVTPGKASGPGVFAAPGVIGLALGGAAAALGLPVAGLLLAGLVAVAATITVLPKPALPYSMDADERDEPIFETHDWIMMALLAAIALRSAVWTTFQFVMEGDLNVLIWLALAAALGKVGGGFLADRFGWRRWSIGALGLAAPLLAIGGESVPALLVGVALLQSATPGMVVAVAQSAPKMPATAAGLAFGLAIALGGLPLVMGIAEQVNSPPVLAGLTLLAALVIWWTVGSGKQGAGSWERRECDAADRH